MRRSRRFRRIFRKVNIFVVVFVAFVNACIYSPIHSLAADSYNFSDFLYGFRFYGVTKIMKPQNTPFVYSSFSSDVFSVPVDNSLPVISGGNTTENSVTTEFDIEFNLFSQSGILPSYYFDDSGYCVIDGALSLTFDFYFSQIYSGGSQLYVDTATAYDSDSNMLPCSILTLTSIDRGSGNYGSRAFIYITFNDLQYFNANTALTKIVVHCRGKVGNASSSLPVIIFPNSVAAAGTVSPGLKAGSSVDITDGYDSSTGDQVASDFESGAASYDQAEDNLFNSADSALTGFKFFDFSTFGTITTGLSFVSGIMTSIYNNFGAMQGLGIVLSVLFSVMFMAIVIGFYRYFK